jgi:putative phage-type endonuclease
MTSCGSTELVNIDNAIDRIYVKLRSSFEPYKLVSEIYDTITCVFTSFCIEKEYVRERLFKILEYQQQLQNLIEIPIVEQRSQEWYDMRQNLITASDFAQALGEGKFGTQKQFFQKKCGYEKDTFDQNNPALKWGVRYEPVANAAYERRNKTKTYEFGLLRHPKYLWFGASPDAISELGIMIEIKCPWKRRITGEVPRQYYYQIQGQLDVCRLEECDYLECEFLEYDNKDEFIRHFNDNLNEKGVLIEYTQDEVTKYEYSDMDDCMNMQKLCAWEEKKRMELPCIQRVYFWQLNTYSVVRVYKEDSFLNEKFPLLKEIWDKIQAYKENKELYNKDFSPSITIGNNGSISSQLNINTIKRGSRHISNTRDVTITGFAFVHDEDDD